MIRLSATLASLAALGMIATPAMALEREPTALAGPAAPVAQGWGYGHGYGPGYGYGHGRHRDNGIDAGDVIAGVLVIGAIAAIASAASNNSRDRYEERYPRRSPAPANYREDYSTSDSGIDRAVDMCVDQVERGSARVVNVDEAARRPDGWRVSGRMSDGESWNCWIDNDGRLRSLDFGEGYAGNGYGAPYREPAYASAAASGQLSDEAYARARAATGRVAPGEPRVGGGIDADLGNGPVPAYPGGPLPGEEGYDEAVRN